MALTALTTSDLFSTWRTRINEIITDVGDKSTLTTTDKTSLVAALNELDAAIGTLSSLNTTEQGSAVGAINEVLAELGDVTTLNTTATDAVDAINEVLAELGDITALTTTVATSAVAGINSVLVELGDITALTTTVTTSAVAAINSNKTEIGDLSALTTTAQTSAVAAINEVDDEAVKVENLQYSNYEPYAGRFAGQNLLSKEATSASITGNIVNGYNSAATPAGDKFVDDNSTYGGAGAALGTDMAALMSALDSKTDRAQFRYGYEFYMLNFTVGAGTNDGDTYSGTDYYPCSSSEDAYLGNIGETVTYMCWMQLKTLAGATSGVVLGHSGGDIDVSIDGAAPVDQYLLTTGDGWVHMRQSMVLTQEYWTFFPGIYGNAGDVISIAMSVLIRGDVKFSMHQGLIR